MDAHAPAADEQNRQNRHTQMVYAAAAFEKDHQGFRILPGCHVRLQETL